MRQNSRRFLVVPILTNSLQFLIKDIMSTFLGNSKPTDWMKFAIYHLIFMIAFFDSLMHASIVLNMDINWRNGFLADPAVHVHRYKPSFVFHRVSYWLTRLYVCKYFGFFNDNGAVYNHIGYPRGGKTVFTCRVGGIISNLIRVKKSKVGNLSYLHTTPVLNRLETGITKPFRKSLACPPCQLGPVERAPILVRNDTFAPIWGEVQFASGMRMMTLSSVPLNAFSRL